MIERFIKNSITLKRWGIFKSRKLSWISCWFFIFFILISLTAEIWANNKPLVLFYNGSMFFPVFKSYQPSDFNIKEQNLVDYKKINLSQKDFAIWPLLKWNPYESNLNIKRYPGAPSLENLLGTDDRGRDVLARLIYGYRYSMLFAISVWFFSFVIGTLLGAFMGYFGGITDLIGQRVVEIVDALPALVIIMTITTVFGRSLWFIITFFSLISWVSISLYMRAEFLQLRKRDFVEASRAQGLGHFSIITKHILPNALNPIITFSPFTLASLIGSLTILDYLGFGLMPPTPSWGELLSQAEKYITTAWWLAVYPSLALFVTLLSLTFIGNGVRDAFDPKQV